MCYGIKIQKALQVQEGICMEKTLHDYFYIKTGQELKLYSSDESSFLIEAANYHVKQDNGINCRSTPPELSSFICECMEQYYQEGISDLLLNKLNDILKDVRIQCLIENVEDRLVAIHIAHLPINPSPRIFGAYMFSNITSLGGLDNLKRCQQTSCCKFFIGRPNAKWCSETCGSRHRVEKMRKNKHASFYEEYI